MPRLCLGPHAHDLSRHLGHLAGDQDLILGAQIGPPENLGLAVEALEHLVVVEHHHRARKRVGLAFAHPPPGGDGDRLADAIEGDLVPRGEGLYGADPGDHLDRERMTGPPHVVDDAQRAVIDRRIAPDEECAAFPVPQVFGKQLSIGGFQLVAPFPDALLIVRRRRRPPRRNGKIHQPVATFGHEARQHLQPDGVESGLFGALVGHEHHVGAPHGVDGLHRQIVRMAGTDADDQDRAHILPYRIAVRAARTQGMTRAIMFMGTGSDVGKSLVVAGLCRAFANRGLRVAPFKPQNMSNNAAVTADGGEIGRAQALQARAARRDPITAMNPVLLKPEQQTGAQVIVRGQRIGSMPAREYWQKRGKLLPDVVAAFDELAASVDLVLVEGAGSASEINLRSGDIANFGFAQAAGLPVVLIGDINRGGVIASLIGTFAVADPADAALIVATLVNKFQGDPALFTEGAAAIAARSGVPCLGPVPMFADAAKLPAEDVLALDQPAAIRKAGFTIVVPRLPRIANFDDLDPLAAEPGVDLVIAPPGKPLPPADLIILPGSKATIADLAALRQQGWDIDVLAHARQGRPVLGICGGYQMLGRTIADPLGLEGPPQTVAGLGLLDVETSLEPHKQLRLETATALGQSLSGYHMHMGVTVGPDTGTPFASVGNAPEGASTGRIWGTYLHGLFAADGFRSAFLARLDAPVSDLAYERSIDATLDGLAAHLESHLDLNALLALARELG